MSTQQILGVVGGVVGSFFGYPQLGFLAGSLVGGLLTPGEKTEGPRVDDLKVQVSTYGAGIPILYVTERVGGNVVWSTDKIEMEETTGGKGGAPEQTTYRYFVHMGIVLCETPRDGSTVSIVQIFQDGKLIYDARSGIPVGSALASSENPHAYFVLYQGHADQLPDPGEEAWMGGPGSVPAYRGVVRIRMNAVECPNGRVPQFSFVISTRAYSEQESSTFANFEAGLTGVVQSECVWQIDTVDFETGAPSRLDVYRGDPNGVVKINEIILPPDQTLGKCASVNGGDVPMAMRGRFNSAGKNKLSIDLINLQAGTSRVIFEIEVEHGTIGVSEPLSAAYDAATSKYAVIGGDGGGAGTTHWGYQILVIGVGAHLVSEPLPIRRAVLAMYEGVVYALMASPTGEYSICLVDAISGAITKTILGPTAPGVLHAGGCMVQSNEFGVYVWVKWGDGARIYKINAELSGLDAWSLVTDDAQTSDSAKSESLVTTFYTNGKTAIVGPSSLENAYDFIRFSALSITPTPISEIIEDQCDRAGENRIDLSGIPTTDVVHGYKLQNPASARSNIDPLLTAFSAYMVDEDGLIKFKKYEDITSVATISYDELGQAEAGAEPADAMPLNRAQEVDLPRSVAVSYIEPLRDYQTASEKEIRQITDANEDMIVELPLATTSDHAKRVAQTILFDRWRAQNTRSCKVSRKYAFLSPGDGITVEYPRGTWRLWRITSMTDTGALCEFNVEPGDAELYTQSAIGATGYEGQQVAPLAPPTRMVIGDWSILRDEDNSAGPYVAMEGFSSTGWTGAELLIGDDDTNLQSRGTVSNAATIGFAETLLGDWNRNVVDETNLLTVNVGTDDLSSITREALLAGTSNVFALGAKGRWEIAQFQRADALGSGRFILSGLRRGLRGTEHATALHAAGDTFVLLSVAGTLKPSMEVGAIGQTRSYRAVSKGRSVSSVPSTPYAGTGEPLKPFSPVDLRKALNGDDIVFSWHRRTRMSENYLVGVFPLGEASERYVLELYTDDTFVVLVRSFNATTPSVTYTAAMQVADGYVSGPIYVSIAQISDQVGRGHELKETL